MNYINKIEMDNKLYLKEIEELKEKYKEEQKKNERLINHDLWWANHNKEYNENGWKECDKKKKEIEKENAELKAQITEMQKQQKQYTTPIESIEQLEYLEKALNKKGTVDMKFVKTTVAVLLKAMKYNKLCESHIKEIA